MAGGGISLTQRSRAAPRGAMTVFAAVTAVTISAGSAAPTPLYHQYQVEMGLSPAMITVVFASYAFALLAALLSAGSLSDHLGRRPMILLALLINAAAMLLFITAGSAWTLVLARVVQGAGVGIATTSLGAAVMDTDKVRGPLINSIAPFVGLTLGALGAGALVTFAPAPTRLVYELLLGLTVLQLLILAVMPETTARRPGALASLRPHVAVPVAARPALLRVTPVNVAGWSLGGFYFSLMPSLVRTATGVASPMVGAVVVAALMLAGTGAIVAVRGWPAARAPLAGAVALIVGVAVTLAGVWAGQAAILLAGTLAAGAGLGLTFSGAMRTVLPLAQADDRAGLLAAIYVESYLAFSVPAIAAGLAAPVFGLAATAYVYGGVVVALALVSLAIARLTPRIARP